MNKIIKLFLSLTLASSFLIATAQVNGGGVNCVTNPATGQVQCNVGINYGGGNGGPNNGAGYPPCSQVPPGTNCVPTSGSSAYVQGQNVRQSNTADLSFFGNLIVGVGGIVRLLPPILLGIAVVVFFYFLIKYLIAGKNDPKERASSLKGLLYSLLAIFIMVTLWGIIAFFGDAIGINPNVQVNAPALPTR